MPKNSNTDKVGNYSFDFDGIDDYIDCGDIAEFDDATALTLSAWIKPVNTSDVQTLISKFTDSNNRTSLGISGNLIYFNVSNGGGKYGTVAFTDTDWTHLVMVFDGSGVGDAGRLKGYVNGVPQTLSFTGTIGTTLADLGTDPVQIGRQDTEYAAGKISEVCIFNYALTSGQITTLYGDATAGVGNPMGLDPVPIGYWKGDKAGLGDQWAVANQVSKDYVFNFDGSDDRIDLPSSIDLGINSTISLWVNMDNGFASCFIGEASYTSDYLMYGSDNVSFHFQIGSYAPNFTTMYQNLTDSVWHNIVMVRTGDSVEAFLDGVSKATVVGYGTGTNTLFDRIGADSRTGGGAFLEGKISNVAAWDSSLTSGNITTIYNNGTPGDLTSLSPVSWWKLDDSATFSTNWSIPDAGSASNTGTSSGMTQGNLVPDTVTRGTAMYSEYSFDFDGVGDVIDCGNPAELQITGALTISLWVKSTDATDYVLVQKDGIGSNRNYALWGNEWGASTFIFWGVWNGVTGTSLSSTISINDGDWHHVVAVYEPSTALRIYIDGVLDAENTTSIPVSINNTASPFEIGRGSVGYGYYMDGLINNMAVWNSVLSAANVTTIYNNGRPADLTDLSPVAWWKLGNEAFWD